MLTEVEIQLPLKRFPDSSVTGPNPNWFGVEGHHATKNLLQYPWVDNWLMAIFPLSGRVKLKSCSLAKGLGKHYPGPWEQMSGPSLAWKNATELLVTTCNHPQFKVASVDLIHIQSSVLMFDSRPTHE